MPSGCQNGIVAASTPEGSEMDYYIEIFTDPACTNLSAVWVLTTATASERTTVSGSMTNYFNGMRLDSLNVQGSITHVSAFESKLTLQYDDVQDSLRSSTGISCDVAAGTGTQIAENCGFGQVVNTSPPEQGVTLSLNVATPDLGTTFTLSGNSAAFTGGAVSLLLSAGAFPGWTIEGGSPAGASQFSGQMQYGAGMLEGESFTLTDGADDARVTMQSYANVDIKGTVTQISSGKTLAKFLVLLAGGDGRVAYDDGTFAPITDWTIIN